MKKNIIIFITVLTGILVIFSIIIFQSPKEKIALSDKYSTTISINTKFADQTDALSLNIQNDGQNEIISSTKLNKPIYIINNKMYFIKDDKLLINRVDSSYQDLKKIILNIQKYDLIEEHSDIKNYTTLLSAKNINEILAALFIDSTVDKSQIINFTTTDKLINTLNVNIDGTSNFEKINISISFDKLQDNFNIDTSNVFGLSGQIKYKIQETKENPLQLKRGNYEENKK